MPSNLFNAMGTPQNNPMGMVNQIRSFAQTFRGNPQQQVQQLLNSGRMTQEQYNELSAKARQLMPFFR